MSHVRSVACTGNHRTVDAVGHESGGSIRRCGNTRDGSTGGRSVCSFGAVRPERPGGRLELIALVAYSK